MKNGEIHNIHAQKSRGRHFPEKNTTGGGMTQPFQKCQLLVDI